MRNGPGRAPGGLFREATHATSSEDRKPSVPRWPCQGPGLLWVPSTSLWGTRTYAYGTDLRVSGVDLSARPLQPCYDIQLGRSCGESSVQVANGKAGLVIPSSHMVSICFIPELPVSVSMGRGLDLLGKCSRHSYPCFISTTQQLVEPCSCSGGRIGGVPDAKDMVPYLAEAPCCLHAVSSTLNTSRPPDQLLGEAKLSVLRLNGKQHVNDLQDVPKSSSIESGHGR
jgi:hypothetical protein